MPEQMLLAKLRVSCFGSVALVLAFIFSLKIVVSNLIFMFHDLLELNPNDSSSSVPACI